MREVAPHALSISIVMPALNEEANLEAAVRAACDCASRYFRDWEILVFDDGSTDKTGSIADRLSAQDGRIRVVHHSSPRNLGACYKEGLEMSTKQYVVMIPGDNECGTQVMEKVFELAGTADMIIPYTANPEVRPWGRQILSLAFIDLVNLISGCRLRYYNGTVLHRTDVIRACPIETNSFGYQAEALVKLIRAGYSYREVGIEITYRPDGKSKALRISNIVNTGRFLVGLFKQARLERPLAPPPEKKKLPNQRRLREPLKES